MTPLSYHSSNLSLIALQTMRLLVLISVVSDIILRISIQEPLLIFKKIVVLLHTLSTYNSLLIHYRVCLCTS